MGSHTILNRRKVYENFFVVEEIECKVTGHSQAFKRFVLKRPDSAAILLHDPNMDEVVFVRQFRAPAIDKDSPDLLEIPAGVVELNESPAECIIRESWEETGYEPVNTLPVYKFYPSPGVSSERIHLFYGEIDIASGPRGSGGGVDSENENIRVERFPFNEAIKMIENGRIIDGKTITALLWMKNRQMP
jgi:nudix-type nucleoside diphosphatase (YffH/AdpP family)